MLLKEKSKKVKYAIFVFSFFVLFSFSEKAIGATQVGITITAGGTVEAVDFNCDQVPWWNMIFPNSIGQDNTCTAGTFPAGASSAIIGTNYSANATTSEGYLYFYWHPATNNTPPASYINYNFFARVHYVGGVFDSELESSGFDSSTHIISTTPNNKEIIATSSTHAIGATGYVSPSDINDYTKLKIHVENSANSFQQCADAICADFSEDAIAYDFVYNILTYGSFSESSTTGNLPIGKYYMTSKVTNGAYCFLGFCAFETTLTSTSTTFTISTTTKIDNIKSGVIDYFDTLNGSGSNFESCGIAIFNLFDCLKDFTIFLFIPTPDALSYFGNQLHDNILTHFPLGYITDFMSIMSTSTVGTITPINAEVPQGLPAAGTTFTLDITGVLDPFLNATTGQFTSTHASSTRTLYEITSDYWDIFVYLLALLYIIRRILGTKAIGKIT